ncbi:LytTR family transcriptional regulator DNA-binding domain-containing protein [Enterococcus sp. DIV2163]|uniref:LytTR family transcriptional regulator DNA-binding domain-containing protein n=1 Tax=Enterococcus sp. DIV2163 TaxID=2774834 RepID=UPI003D2FC512
MLYPFRYFKFPRFTHKCSNKYISFEYLFLDIELKDSELNGIEDRNHHFIRCHRLFVVNTQNIQMINKKIREVTLENGDIIPVSIRGLKKLIT